MDVSLSRHQCIESLAYLLPQSSQVYGFSPECRRKCVCKFPAWLQSGKINICNVNVPSGRYTNTNANNTKILISILYRTFNHPR